MASNIDKKVFYADQLLSSQAGTVSDILNNVPSVTTDTDGKPSLRGNENVMVLIDGKPSGLAGTNLSQLPASSIQAIEVITIHRQNTTPTARQASSILFWKKIPSSVLADKRQ